jgi:hypothetical protein
MGVPTKVELTFYQQDMTKMPHFVVGSHFQRSGKVQQGINTVRIG